VRHGEVAAGLRAASIAEVVMGHDHRGGGGRRRGGCGGPSVPQV